MRANATLGGLLDFREAAALLDEGRSLAQATQALRSRYFAGRELGDIHPPVMIGAAIAAAERLAVSTDMARKIAGTGKLMLAWRGEMPLEVFIEPKRVFEFLMWVRRLPKNHGQLHGNNRYRQDRPEPDKHQVIADADERDRLLREEVAARDDLDLRQKRAHLAKVLEPRVTDAAVENHHARLTAIIGAARSELGWHGPAFTSVLSAYRKEATRTDNRAEDPLDLRVTKAKKRSIWIAARMTTLLTSPIYTGCSTVERRWKPGTKFIRDGMYWSSGTSGRRIIPRWSGDYFLNAQHAARHPELAAPGRDARGAEQT